MDKRLLVSQRTDSVMYWGGSHSPDIASPQTKAGFESQFLDSCFIRLYCAFLINIKSPHTKMWFESQFLVFFIHKEYALISVGCHVGGVLAESHQDTVVWSEPVWDRVLVRPRPGSIWGSSRRQLYCKHRVGNDNVVRIPLNEECWLGVGNQYPMYFGKHYTSAVVSFVNPLWIIC